MSYEWSVMSYEWMYRLRRWDLEVGAYNLAAPSDEGAPEGWGRENVLHSYEFTINRTDFRLFLSFRRPHLPHQRKALIWKPLPTKIIIHITDSSCIADQWSALRILSIDRAKLKAPTWADRDVRLYRTAMLIRASNRDLTAFQFRKLSTIHFQLSTCPG